MQQTTNYKLNLIETSDVFSPEALNGNAEKLDTGLASVRADLTAEANTRASAVTALDKRVKTCELRHFAAGAYTTDVLKSVQIKLDFDPKAVFVAPAGKPEVFGVLIAGRNDYNGAGMIISKGFEIGAAGLNGIVNRTGTNVYLAFA